jgi:hypothetical protein
MYQFSRELYRELLPVLQERQPSRTPFEVRRSLLLTCEATIQRLASDRDYFAWPARTLFREIRNDFSVYHQRRVYRIVDHYMTLADEFLLAHPGWDLDADGTARPCRALTRQNTQCRRTPVAANGYCPSHQHLAATEHCPPMALAA